VAESKIQLWLDEGVAKVLLDEFTDTAEATLAARCEWACDEDRAKDLRFSLIKCFNIVTEEWY